ncbi:MAG: mechanosensitive ion channel [Methylobacteriaceae bacterium]|nr:mechanosensitive ion channel [Methylobacteriaceae bacterium]
MRLFLKALFVAAAWLAVGSSAATAGAADSPITLIVTPSDRPEDIARLLDMLKRQDRPVLVRIGEPASTQAPAASTPDAEPAKAAPDAAAAPTESNRPDPPPAATSQPSLAETVDHALRRLVRREGEAISALPAAAQDVTQAWGEVRNGSPWGAAGLLLVILVGAIATAIVVDSWLSAVARHRVEAHAPGFIARLGAAARQLAVDGAALALGIAAGRALIAILLPQTDLAHSAALELLEYLAVVGLYVLAGRLALAPQAPQNRLMPLPRAERHFWLFVLYGAFGYAVTPIVHLLSEASEHKAGVVGFLSLAGILVTIYKVWWFWTGRHDISTLVRTTGPDPDHPGLLRRVGASIMPILLVAVALGIMVIAHLFAFSQRAGELARVAGITQLLVIFLPMLTAGVDAFFRDLAARRHAQRNRLLEIALAMAGRTLLVSVLWLGGLAIVVSGWAGLYLPMEGQQMTASAQMLSRVAAIAVVGIGLWVFLRTIFDAYAEQHQHASMPGVDEDAIPPVESRLGTVMPLLRGLALAAVIAVTALLILSHLNVNISPLLAGAGVIGLALSFGSQALVRDIVSGIFFMADDAFRIGEYIDTGRLKGTVEKITLRSVQLRHQNGQVHTVPFGQLQAITNFSRDWSTVKFNIAIEHGSDLGKARKVIKSVGAQMLQDPELGPEFILPLKLQGVADITAVAIVLRLKFTAKPVHASWLQREAMKRVYNALRAAGIDFASNAVTVRASHPELSAPAAAAQAAAAPANPA